MSDLLVHVMRGGYVESRHYGDVALVDRSGKIIYSIGDPHRFTFWRSAAKPFQIIPFVEDGGVEEFNITMKELAIMVASHGGEKEHVRTIESILKKINMNIENLDCGIAPPMFMKEREELLKEEKEFKLTHNGCSGKHSAMLALGALKNIDTRNYISKEHFIQKIIFRTIAQCCNIREEDMVIAIDGCGVPVFGMAIDEMARAYARFSLPEEYFSQKRAKAIRKIISAMIENPFYVAGTERLDTVLMKNTKGRIIAKFGAESVYNIGIIDEGIGICVKIDDGNPRAIDPVIIKILKDLNFLSKEEEVLLEERLRPKLKNHRGEVIGELQPVFKLIQHK